ncbi:hypothetical protein PFMALIP_02873 [Plasmodium falciparum MaliPS096_E11]|uniref:Peptidase A1 domain-containing protein n=1 Tax=Plasmodium falciparum MaliPS096_E11 TaxID=1036727 RepID=A0A024WRL8_PLAFA|nr:hypothetical protein PFMALIP_02873 [Plasmodium falciparum MaliPS096_E11]
MDVQKKKCKTYYLIAILIWFILISVVLSRGEIINKHVKKKEGNYKNYEDLDSDINKKNNYYDDKHKNKRLLNGHKNHPEENKNYTYDDKTKFTKFNKHKNEELFTPNPPLNYEKQTLSNHQNINFDSTVEEGNKDLNNSGNIISQELEKKLSTDNHKEEGERKKEETNKKHDIDTNNMDDNEEKNIYEYFNKKTKDNFDGLILNIYFTPNNNLYTKVKVGDQVLKLSLNSRLEGVYVFMKDSPACYLEDDDKRTCYNPLMSRNSTWCNNDLMCLPAILTKPYECYEDSSLNLENKVQYPNVYYDSLKFNETHIEGSDDLEFIDLVGVQTKYIRNKKKKMDVNKMMSNENKSMDPKHVENNLQNNNILKRDNIIIKPRVKLSENSNLLFQGVDIKLVVDMTFYNDWNLFKDTDGMFGLAGKELSCRNISAWNNILENNNSIFALDINLPNDAIKTYPTPPVNSVGTLYYEYDLKKNGDNKKSSDQNINNVKDNMIDNKNVDVGVQNINEFETSSSVIHIGNYSKEYGNIIWSEPRERGGIFSDSFIQFTIYNLEVCNKNIFGKYSSNWQAIIDLSSQYYEENSLPRMCSVDHRNRPLPTLKFFLSDNDIVSDNNIYSSPESENKGKNEKKNEKQAIYIPLDNLIINDKKNNQNYLCVIPDVHDGRSTENSARTTKPLIKFGTYVLNNFYVVVDQENYKVGFANKKSFHTSNEKCTQRTQCIGDQYYEPALNICVDPDCSIWYFYTLNDQTKKCESLSSRFYVFIIIILTLLILDIQSYYFYRKSVHVAKTSSR